MYSLDTVYKVLESLKSKQLARLKEALPELQRTDALSCPLARATNGYILASETFFKAFYEDAGHGNYEVNSMEVNHFINWFDETPLDISRPILAGFIQAIQTWKIA